MQNKTFEETRKSIEERLTDATKCYLLIKYSYNTKEEDELYKREFTKRYINFYRNIINIEKEIDEEYIEGMSDKFKDIFNIGFYKEKMKFLSQSEIGETLEDNNVNVDIDYDKKTSNSTVKLHFYHANNLEFGIHTRFHVNTSKYGVIDPVACNEEETTFIFNVMTEYFIKECFNDTKNNKKNILKLDM